MRGTSYKSVDAVYLETPASGVEARLVDGVAKKRHGCCLWLEALANTARWRHCIESCCCRTMLEQSTVSEGG